MLVSLASWAGAAGVNIVSVRFNNARLSGQSDPWLETEIFLRAPSGEAVSDVSVSCALSFRSRGQALLWRGDAKISAIENAARVRFYLPPEVMRTYRLTRSPSAYEVKISSSSGEAYFASPSLRVASVRQIFEKTAPTGALLPHYKTPFYSLSETFRDLPAYEIP